MEHERIFRVTWKDGSVKDYPWSYDQEDSFQRMKESPSAPKKIEYLERKIGPWERFKEDG